jgi:hypothetical protein
MTTAKSQSITSNIHNKKSNKPHSKYIGVVRHYTNTIEQKNERKRTGTRHKTAKYRRMNDGRQEQDDHDATTMIKDHAYKKAKSRTYQIQEDIIKWQQSTCGYA